MHPNYIKNAPGKMMIKEDRGIGYSNAN